MLSVMLSYATLGRVALGTNTAEADADIVEIEKAGRRAAELTKKLLTVSRQQPVKTRIVDLNDSIAELDGMFRRVLGANISCARFARSWQRGFRPKPITPSALTKAVAAALASA